MIVFLLLHLASEEKNHMQHGKFNCLVVWCFSLKQKRKIKLQKLVLEALKMAVALVVQSTSAVLLSENPQRLHTRVLMLANILD